MRLRRFGPWVRHIPSIGLLLVGVGLWVWHLQNVDWHGMHRVVVNMPHESFMWAMVFTTASYLVYSSIDLLAKRLTGHRIDAAHTLAIGFVSHACALNLGPAGAGFRFMLYMKHGLDAPMNAAVWLFNIMTNWIGFVLLAGLAFATEFMSLPTSWGVADGASPLIGVTLLTAVACYLVVCAKTHGHSWMVLGRRLTLPTLGIATLQCAVSVANWSLIAWVLTMLMQHKVGFASVLAALMTSALALAVIDVPAGLGVLETVLIAMLGGQIPAHELLVAMLAYRAIYFLAPLLIALLVYVALEFDMMQVIARRKAARPSHGTSAFNAMARLPLERSLAPPPGGFALRPRPPSSRSRRSPP